MKTYHSAFDLDYLLRLRPEEAGCILKDAVTNQPIPSEAVKMRACILKAKGFEVMPVGCDHYNDKGYCLGHPNVQNGQLTEQRNH